MKMWKKVLVGVALCSMAAGVASAQTVWISAATNGYWDAPGNWNNGLPLADTKTQFYNDTGACIVTNIDAVAGQLVIGDGGNVANLHVLRIASGGILTSGTAGDGWTAVSYNRNAHCVVEAGGTWNTLARLGVGLVGDGNGLLEVYGDVAIAGTLQVAPGADRTGKVMLYGGGTISAITLEMGDDGLIDIWQDGVLTFAGDYTNQVAAAIDSGKILGNRLTNNFDVALDTTTTPGVTNTVITVIPSIPNLAGLTTNEAAEVLAVFGYVVGETTEGSVPGGITGLVAAQVPAAGTAPLAPGSSIDLVVQEAGEVPNLVGLDYAVATNLIAASGYVFATGTVTYVYDQTPGLVTGQDPAGGTAANPGDTVTIDYNEPKAASSIIVGLGIGDWMSSNVWDTLVVPYKETQNYEVQLRGGSSITLSNNFVAIRRTHIGHNGQPAVAQLDLIDGAHVVAGHSDYAAVGWNAPAVLNVSTNCIFEGRKALRVGWNGSSATINIDGGSVLFPNDWLSVGKFDKLNPDTSLPYESEINIKNGGRLLINYLRDTNYRFGHINLEGGSFATTGTSLGDINDGLASGFIVVAEGYASSIDVIDGNATLSTWLPTYAGWAMKEGIGGENEDQDLDLRDNLYEYALNGDPNDDQSLGEEPVMVDLGGSLVYTHLQRSDDTNLVYSVETTTDLASGPWAPGYAVAVGTNVTGNAYDVVTNTIPTSADEIFIRLKVTNP